MFNINSLRQYRIGPFTLFDSVTAYLGVLILSPLLTWLFKKMHLQISVLSWLWLTLPISVLFHLFTRQNTPLMKILSQPLQYEFYIVLLVLLFMSYMGLKDINKLKKI